MLSILEKIRQLYSKILEGDEDVLATIRTEVGDENMADDVCIKLLEVMYGVIVEIEECF